MSERAAEDKLLNGVADPCARVLLEVLLGRLEAAEARISALEEADHEAERIARERRRYNLTRRHGG